MGKNSLWRGKEGGETGIAARSLVLSVDPYKCVFNFILKYNTHTEKCTNLKCTIR